MLVLIVLSALTAWVVALAAEPSITVVGTERAEPLKVNPLVVSILYSELLYHITPLAIGAFCLVVKACKLSGTGMPLAPAIYSPRTNCISLSLRPIT